MSKAPWHNEEHDEHNDPTGVRALLAGLPDPGPMPEDLVDRIQARLELERTHLDALSTDGSSGHGPAGEGSPDGVVDLAAERSRRRPGRVLAMMGAAAAGLLVVSVSASQLLGTGDSDDGVAAQYPSLSDSAGGSDSAAQDDAGDAGQDVGASGEDAGAADRGHSGADEDVAAEEEPAESRDEEDAPVATLHEATGDGEAGEAASPGPVDGIPLLAGLTILPSLGTVEAELIGTAVLQAAQDAVAASQTPGVGDLTVSEASVCWHDRAVERPWDEYYATLATLTGSDWDVDEEVVVLLGLDASGAGQTWVLPPACTTSTDVEPLSTSTLVINP